MTSSYVAISSILDILKELWEASSANYVSKGNLCCITPSALM